MKMKKNTMKIVSVAIIIELITMIAVPMQKSYASSWIISNVSLDHTSVQFKLSGVESAQNATFVIEEHQIYGMGNVVMEIPFSITGENAIYNLSMEEGQFLPEGNYKPYIIKEDETCIEYYQTEFVSVGHTVLLGSEGNAYPTCFVGKLSKYEYIDKLAIDVKAIINFQEYEGSFDEEGNIVVSYPTQSVGNTVSIVVTDSFGCQSKNTLEVKDKGYVSASINVWRNGLTYNLLGSNQEDERIGVCVDGKTYYTQYGLTSEKNNQYSINYPDTQADTVEVWRESLYGSISTRETYQVMDCAYDECEYTFVPWPSQMVGTVKTNKYGQRPTIAIATINGKEYKAEVASDGSFKVIYPFQENIDTKVYLSFSDAHGCMYKCKNYKEINNSLYYSKIDAMPYDVLPTKTLVNGVGEGVRLVAKIGTQVYYSDYMKSYGVATVTYPIQTVGTSIILWLEHENTSKSFAETVSVYGDGSYTEFVPRTASAQGDIFMSDYYEASIDSAYVLIGDKKYDCVITKKQLVEDDDLYATPIYYYHYEVNYPLQKIGTKVVLCYTDSEHIFYSETSKLKNIRPILEVNKVYSTSTQITGKTEPKAKVTIKVGKKKYTVKASAKGLYSKKIKQQKAGVKIQVSVLTKEGYFTSNSIKVKQAKGIITVAQDIFVNSNSIKIKLTKVSKGDKIKVKIGSKNYIKKLNVNKKSVVVTLKIKKPVAGSDIKITYVDKFGKKKDTYTSYVFSAKTITVGMSANDALLTPWGAPVMRNRWGSLWNQWVFKSGDSTLYAYVKNGRVVDVDIINY